MLKRLLLKQAHWEAMRTHEDACAPEEACGLLAGVGDAVREVMLITNLERSPRRFLMDAREQLDAFRTIEERGMELLGVFHSHPASAGAGSVPPQGPSATDIRQAAYPVVHVIWSQPEGRWQARGFWIEDGGVSSVPLIVSPDQ